VKRQLLISIALGLFANIAAAAIDTGLYYDAHVPQAVFAASEIRKSFAGLGQSLVETGLDHIAAGAYRTRILIVTDPSQSARISTALAINAPKASAPSPMAFDAR